ncbi:MAG: type IV secretion system protein [Pseudomonadota bacterium]|nr:type IV secretion system protein [Pseudomonadota bacterium]MDE3037174.1 type IV secretion system protein [Pseudomonadota bacterium]
MLPPPAFAYSFTSPTTIGSDGTVCPGSGLTVRMVSCIKETVLYAIGNDGSDGGPVGFLLPFSNYLAATDAVACTLAIALWGLLVVSGKQHALSRDGFVLMLKIGAVVLVTSNFSGWFNMLLDIEDSLLGVVSTYAVNFSNLANNGACPANGGDPSLAIWNTVDCAIQTLIGGIFDPTTLMLGVGGFFFACLLSSALGMFIALLGAYLIGSFLMIIARALYIFISAYIGIAVMFIMLPLILPMILFSVTKPYFDKWFRLTLTFIVQPLFLFAYLSMLVAAFDTVIYTGPNSLYRAIAGSNVDSPDFELGGWLLNDGAYSDDEIGGVGIEINPTQVQNMLGIDVPVNQGALGSVGEVANAQALDWQDGIFHALGIGDNGVSDARFVEPNLPTTVVDWSFLASMAGAPDTTTYVIGVLLALFMAVVTCYILLQLLDFIPYIGAGIAGIPVGMPVFGVSNAGGVNMSPPGGGMLDQLKGKLAKNFSDAFRPKAKPAGGN